MNQKPQLFLLHFAGGNSYSFQFMLPYLNDFEVFRLELPGRGNRMNEKLLSDFDEAAADIYEQILRKQTTANYLIYGHSLGAYLALKVTSMLEEAGKPPAHIIVSGNAGPGISKDKKRYLLKDDEFITELRILGGIPEEVIENKELFDFFEPILRADFELAERNSQLEQVIIKTSLYALMGSEEEDKDKLSNWKRFTTSNFQCEVLKGNHFFIFNHPQRIAQLIKQCWDQVSILQYQ